MSTSVSSGGGSADSTDLDREPDWDHCLDIPNIQIKDAVSLSIGINPSNYDDIQADIIKRKQYFPDKVCEEELGQVKRWHKRLLLAKRHAENGSLKIAKSAGVHWMVPEAVDIEHSEVNLVAFVQWSQSLRTPWKLPEPLMNLSCVEQVGEDDELSIGDTLKVIATLLKVIQANAKSHNQSWVSDAIAEDDKYKIQGIGKRKLNGIFASANKELKK